MDIMKAIKKSSILWVVMLLALVLRIWRLNEAPVALFGDELDVGLQAKSILQTGKDYLGNDWPVFFRSFAEYRLPMQLYLAVPFVAIFGMNEWGVRLASVTIGLLSILAIYLLAEKLFDKKVAIVSSLLMSISPWHLQLSRQANDSGFLLPFVLFGCLFLVQGKSNPKYLFMSAILFSLSFYTYPIAVVFVPIFVFIYMFIYREEFTKLSYNNLLWVGLITAFIVAPYAIGYMNKKATHRISYLTSSGTDEIIQEVVDNRRWSNTSTARMFYNRHVIFSENIINRYIISYSPQFLFFDGDPNPRHSISKYGMLYHFEIITLIIGVYYIIRNRVKNISAEKTGKLLLIWLLLAPLPAAMAGDAFHAPRLILMLPPLILLSAYGVVQISMLMKNHYVKIISLMLIIYVLFDVSKYFHRYHVIWPNESWKFWHYGFEQTIGEFKSIEIDYDKVFFNNTYEPMLQRFLFWTDYDMRDFHEQFEGDEHINRINENFLGFKLTDKYYFGEILKPVEPLAQPGYLVVASGENDITNPSIFENSHLRLINTIESPDGIPIFYIFTGE